MHSFFCLKDLKSLLNTRTTTTCDDKTQNKTSLSENSSFENVDTMLKSKDFQVLSSKEKRARKALAAADSDIIVSWYISFMPVKLLTYILM